MKLRELREKTKLNQTETAKRLNIPRVNYNKYENGEVEPNIETLKLIADYYQTSLDYLCDFNPPYQFTLPALNEEQKKAIKILLKLPPEIFYYMFAKLENYQEQFKIDI